MSEIQAPREALGEWLTVASAGDGTFRAELEDHFGAAQEGDLLARCALAALGARPGATLASLHADWLAPAPPRAPITLRVAPLGADGARCEVTASAGAPLCRVSARLAAGESGLAYQDDALPAGLPRPEALPSTVEYARKEGWPEAYAAGPVEFRRVGPLRPNRALGESAAQVTWLSLRAPLPREPRLEQAALVFLATFYAHWEFERRVGARFDYPSHALRSQALFLHRAARPDGWLLLRAESRRAAGGNALGTRALFAEDGALLATVVSEAAVAEAKS